MDYNNQARRIIQHEKEKAETVPGTPIFLDWRGDTYLAVMYEVRSPYGNEIVGLEILSIALTGELEGLVKAVIQLDSKRPKLTADYSLDLKGTRHLLKKVESTLTFMESEQLEYFHRVNFTFSDSSTGERHELEYDHRYKDPKDIDSTTN